MKKLALILVVSCLAVSARAAQYPYSRLQQNVKHLMDRDKDMLETIPADYASTNYVRLHSTNTANPHAVTPGQIGAVSNATLTNGHFLFVLPSATNGLSDGMLWNNSGTVTVFSAP